MTSASSGPLEGLRVLEIGHFLAAPFGTLKLTGASTILDIASQPNDIVQPTSL